MANLCDTQFIITCGSKEPIMNLWESMKELGAVTSTSRALRHRLREEMYISERARLLG